MITWQVEFFNKFVETKKENKNHSDKNNVNSHSYRLLDEAMFRF